ncbi:acyltransferase [Vibrio sp. Vb339]|uniref:acyltransferase n=1 Tax=Vibrio sp. Vb339 TaxID=1192013 RepID=UPI001C131F21|nr:acyltransferase [Vibrio sp. Vb339]
MPSVRLLIPVIIKFLRAQLYRFIFRVKGNVFFWGSNSKIIGSGAKLFIGHMSKVESNCVIQTDSLNGIYIGDKCTIGEGTMIRPSSFYGGVKGFGFEMQDGSAIGVRSYIGCSGRITIGKNVIIGPNFTAIAENHNYDGSGDIKEQGVSNKGIDIEPNVWVGCNVTILDGVTIQSNTVVAAGSVITKSFPGNVLLAGIPAKIIKKL